MRTRQTPIDSEEENMGRMRNRSRDGSFTNNQRHQSPMLPKRWEIILLPALLHAETALPDGTLTLAMAIVFGVLVMAVVVVLCGFVRLPVTVGAVVPAPGGALAAAAGARCLGRRRRRRRQVAVPVSAGPACRAGCSHGRRRGRFCRGGQSGTHGLGSRRCHVVAGGRAGRGSDRGVEAV